MKKTILALSLAFASLGLYAQENQSQANYKTNGLWDNWFANLGGGASMYFGEGQRKEADFFERMTWGATASVGKWITPVYGARLTFQGGQKHTFNKNGIPMFNKDGESVDLSTVNEGNIRHMATGYYISAHADALLNFSNLIAGYKEDRVYNLIPYVGVGIATDRKKVNNLTGVVSAGLLNTFRLNEKLAISLDISGQAVQSKFNDAKFPRGTKSYDRQDWAGIGSVTLGLTFGLGGKQNFDKAGTVTIIDNTDNSLVADLNGQINDLIIENENLKKQLSKEPVVTTTPTSSIAVNVPNPVQFEINSSTIGEQQEAVIYNVAEFLKKNPNTSVQIVGLADKKTGSPAYNKALSQKRAKAVENKLTKDYGISKSRIISSWKGDSVQPYPTNEWNRVVIITVVDSEK